MKKIISGILFSIIGFFFFNYSVYAVESSVVMSDTYQSNIFDFRSVLDGYDGNIFNLFYERSNSTNFYNKLTGGVIPFGDGYLTSFYLFDELNYFLNKYDAYSDIKYAVDSFSSIPYYVVIDFYFGCNTIDTFYDNGSYLSLQGSIRTRNCWVNNKDEFKMVLYFYTVDGEFYRRYSSDIYDSSVLNRFAILTSYKYYYTWYNQPWWKFWKKDTYTGSDFSLFYSKFYYTKFSIKSSNNILLYTAYINNRDFGDDLSSVGLDYFDKNPIVSSSSRLDGLKYILFDYLISYKIPSNFSSVNLIDNKGILFVPRIDVNKSSSDYLVYVSSYSDLAQAMLHRASNFNNFQGWSYSYMGSKAYNVSTLDLGFSYLKLSSSPDNSYAFFVDSINYKYDYFLYYNSSAYDIYIYSSDSTSYTINGIDYSYNSIKSNLDSYYREWGNNNLNGVSCDIYQKWNGKECVPISSFDDSYVYDENGDLIEVEDSFAIDNILNNAWDGIQSFVNASYRILSMSTDLFYLLPPEISSLLVFTFTIGLIILIWKLFH